MNTTQPPAPRPFSLPAPVVRLAYTVAGLGVGLFGLTMAVAASGVEPDQMVWNRAGGVLAGSLICLVMVKKAAAGKRWAYSRVRWITVIATVLVAATVLIPSALPVWFRAEQAVHLLAVAALAYALNTPALRAAFRGDPVAAPRIEAPAAQ